MLSTTLKSFAKINIGLRILKKRDDGYHDIETIFYPVSLFDEIKVQIESNTVALNSVSLTSNKSFIPLNKYNLCYKAIENFFKAFEIKDYFKIKIDLNKKIPVGGGLGGGSSNAAAVLKFLIKYFSIDIFNNKEKINNLALSIGSDVPFFLIMKPCYAEGRGEKLKILKDFIVNYDILIVNPNLHISTKWAFENLGFKNENNVSAILNDVQTFNINDKTKFTNDFENLVFKKHKILNEIKNELDENGSVYSSMSGSGATMFGFFDKKNKKKMHRTKYNFANKNYFTFISE